MKITSVTPFAIRVPLVDSGVPDTPSVSRYGDLYIDQQRFTSVYASSHQTTLIKVETDTGVSGWGEAQSPVAPAVTAAIMEHLIAPQVVGKDPHDIELLWARLYGAMRERGHSTGFYPDALAGLDIALWDLLGKWHNLPVHKLCGGRFRPRIPLYAGLGGTEPARVVAEAQQLVAAGYSALKLHLLLDTDGCAHIAECVRAAVGPEIRLMVDVHTRHTVPSAIRLGRQLERNDVYWLEAPVAPEDVAGQAEVARSLDMAVAAGEWSRTRYEMRAAFEQRAYDIVMHDIGRTGITEGKRITTLADTYGIPTAPHVGGGGAVAVAATVQFSATCPNFDIMEHSHSAQTAKCAILATPFYPKEGAFVVTDLPGLGIEIDESAVAKYQMPG